MRSLSAFSVLLLVAACQAPPAEMTEAEVAQIEAEVTEWSEAWMDGWGPENRCEIITAFYHPDHANRFRGGEPRGRDGVREWCEATTGNWASFSGNWTDIDVRVISPDAAMFTGRYDGTWEYTNGGTGHYPTGSHRILVERTVDGWGATMGVYSTGPRAEG
jgi:hypothetical protein